ncbi:MAG: nuclear transport factor 2 family protein [Cystobacter sp.]
MGRHGSNGGWGLLLSGCLFGMAAQAREPGPEHCPLTGDQAISGRHRAWILEGWERREADPPFVFSRQLGRFYSESDTGVRLYDDFDPEHRVAHGASQYAAIFEPVFREARSARHAVVDGPWARQSGALGTSVLEFVVRLEGKEGALVAARTRSSLVWRCEKGRWNIVEEHNSSTFIPVAEAEAALARAAPGKDAPAPAGQDRRSLEDRNTQLVRDAFERWARGQGNLFHELLDEQVTWTIEGSGPSARTYHGRDAFLAGAVTPFSRKLATPLRPRVKALWSDGDTVIVQWSGDAETRAGAPYHNDYVWILRMAGGKVKEATAFLNLVAYETVLRSADK